MCVCFRISFTFTPLLFFLIFFRSHHRVTPPYVAVVHSFDVTADGDGYVAFVFELNTINFHANSHSYAMHIVLLLSLCFGFARNPQHKIRI